MHGPRTLGCALAALVLVLVGLPAARAQEREHVVRVAGSPTFPGRGELWARRVARALGRDGATVVTPTAIDWDRAGFDEARLRELEEIEAALGVARRMHAALEEAEALRALAAASRRARELLDVPGASAWLAETEVVTAIVAAQRGDASLADASLRRALALAPDRALQEGEAPPELVAQSLALMREEVRRARLEVRVEGSAAAGPAEAEVFVDDRALGRLPRELELPAGLHVIRIEARGHRPYARLVDLAPGSRAPMVVALAPSEANEASHTLDEAVRRGEPDAVASALAHVVAAGGRARDVWLVYVGTGALDRAVLVRCRPGACEAPRRIDDTAVLAIDARDAAPADTHPADTHPADMHPADTAPDVQGLALARAWIDEAPVDVTPPEPSLLEAWWLWTAVGVAVIGAGVAIGVAATQPSGEAPLVLRFDPCTQCAR